MLERMTFDTTRPNGILLSPDKKWLYVAQSDYRDQADRELRAYPVGDDGSLGKHRVIHDFYPSRAVDGMCLDSNGNIIACTGWERDGPGPMIHIFTPDGDVQERHSFPAGPPTNCCFGGADLQTLYITEKDGGLYRVKTERTGLLGAP
jgi:gluconolactonase